VSCPTEGFCVAVDLLGRYLTFNGTSWSAPQPIATGFGVPTSVSCASENFCATVDGGVGIEVGNVITYGGAIAGWGDANTLDAGAQSISCPSATFCGVDDQSGDTLTYDPAEAIDDVTNPLVSHLDPGSLESVSCPSQSFCATVDNNGLASTYNGSGWSSLAQIDPNAFASVSCASQNFCVAVDKQGGAVLYELTPNNTAPPAIAGTAQQSDTLTATTGTWSNNPSSFTYQWQDCTGASCAPIVGATASSYALTTGDVGHTIEVVVTATNGVGSSTPVSSAPTAAVTAISPTPSPAGNAAPPAPSGPTAAQIAAALHTLHGPTGKAAAIASILKHAGVALSFNAPGAGKLTIDWYVAAKHGKKTVKTLVAQGKRTITKGKTTVTIKLTGNGKHLLKHSKRPLKLTMTSTFTPTGGKPTTVSSTFKLKP
jgi:hypothetical protein